MDILTNPPVFSRVMLSKKSPHNIFKWSRETDPSQLKYISVHRVQDSHGFCFLFAVIERKDF